MDIQDLHIENDKINSPFLLACSFAGFIKYLGSYSQDGVLYFKFSPKERALTLLDQLQTKTDPHIPAQDLFNAIEVFWKQVSKTKQMKDVRDKGNHYGKR